MMTRIYVTTRSSNQPASMTSRLQEEIVRKLMTFLTGETCSAERSKLGLLQVALEYCVQDEK